MEIMQISRENKNIALNVLASLVIRGAGIVISVLIIPLYLKYLDNNVVLGAWFTILSVLTWILTFDMGIGNGLRNHLTREVCFNNHEACRSLISSAYISLGIIVMCVCIAYYIISSQINWNVIFNIDPLLVSKDDFKLCVDISVYGVIMSFFLRLVTSILYALQKAAIPNLLNVSSHILLLLFLFFAPKSIDYGYNLNRLAIAHAISTNIPLIIATIYIFGYTQLKECKPRIKYFCKGRAKSVISIGINFLYLQILYMIITTTNEWFIGYYYSPQYNTEYQIYYKVFSLISGLFMIAIVPIWSAISKASAEKRYSWIKKMIKILYILVGGLTIIQFIIFPLLPHITRIWLGDNAIEMDYGIAIWFMMYSVILTWVAVQSTIVSGLNRLKTQTYGYTFSVLFKCVAIILGAKYFNSWSFIIIITCISLLPYCIIEPIKIHKYINTIIKTI